MDDDQGAGGRGGHATRALLVSRRSPGTLLLVSRGSGGGDGDGVDEEDARDRASGISQIRAFDVGEEHPLLPHDFASAGTLLGWGLRDAAGVAEEPRTGGIYSVENSAGGGRGLARDGVDDVHHWDNPGEELNFHGFLPLPDDDDHHHHHHPD